MANLLKILVVIIGLTELGFVLLGDPSDQRLYRGVHLIQMVSLIAIVVVAAPFSIKQIAITGALLAAFSGDVINSHLIDFSALYSPQVLLSIPFFLITHLVYCAVFWKVKKQQLMLSVLIALIASAMMLNVFAPEVGLGMMVGLAVYFMVLLTMALMSTSFLLDAGAAKFVALGAWIFVISDLLIGSTLFLDVERTPTMDTVIWLAYIYGQMAISCVLLWKPAENKVSEEAAV